MAKASTPKAVDKDVYGATKKATTTKGPHGGGNAFNQMKPSSGFRIQNVKGHSQKTNLK